MYVFTWETMSSRSSSWVNEAEPREPTEAGLCFTIHVLLALTDLAVRCVMFLDRQTKSRLPDKEKPFCFHVNMHGTRALAGKFSLGDGIPFGKMILSKSRLVKISYKKA